MCKWAYEWFLLDIKQCPYMGTDYPSQRIFFFFFFLKNFCWTHVHFWGHWYPCFGLHTHVHFWGHWYPCFGLLVTSPLGFKARVGFALFTLGRGLHHIRSLRFTSGATPLPVYNATIVASCLPHVCFSRGGMPGFEPPTSCSAVWCATHPATATVPKNLHL